MTVSDVGHRRPWPELGDARASPQPRRDDSVPSSLPTSRQESPDLLIAKYAGSGTLLNLDIIHQIFPVNVAQVKPSSYIIAMFFEQICEGFHQCPPVDWMPAISEICITLHWMGVEHILLDAAGVHQGPRPLDQAGPGSCTRRRIPGQGWIPGPQLQLARCPLGRCFPRLSPLRRDSGTMLPTRSHSV